MSATTTPYQMLYRLAWLVRELATKVEDQDSSGLLITDGINGLLQELMREVNDEYTRANAERPGSTGAATNADDV